MIMKIVYSDGSWVIGNRKWNYLNETKGTHHFLVLDGSNAEYKSLVGQKIAVVIQQVRYFILDWQHE